VPQDRADPEECLRTLTAEALLGAVRGQDLLPVSLGLQATANAFVMPAEGYLAELARVTSYSTNGAEVGPREVA
jgi:hypothetical protein